MTIKFWCVRGSSAVAYGPDNMKVTEERYVDCHEAAAVCRRANRFLMQQQLLPHSARPVMAGYRPDQRQNVQSLCEHANAGRSISTPPSGFQWIVAEMPVFMDGEHDIMLRCVLEKIPQSGTAAQLEPAAAITDGTAGFDEAFGMHVLELVSMLRTDPAWIGASEDEIHRHAEAQVRAHFGQG